MLERTSANMGWTLAHTVPPKQQRTHTKSDTFWSQYAFSTYSTKWAFFAKAQFVLYNSQGILNVLCGKWFNIWIPIVTNNNEE